MRFTARFQMMAASEILTMIPASEYERIKREDPSPTFRAYVIGHEGEATGKVVGRGNVVARWFKSAVENIAARLGFGTKIFHDHGATNEHAGRTPIGEVVGKAVKKIADKLSAIAVVYIRPEFRNLPLDVASIEADVRFSANERTDEYEADVNDITGIALGNSQINRPGFANASLLAQVQAFASSKYSSQGDAMDQLTLEDVRTFIRTEKLKPSDIFSTESLSSDPAVKGFMETETRRAVSGEYAHRKRDEEKFAEEKKTFEERIKKLEGDVTSRDVQIASAKLPTLLSRVVGARKLSDAQKRFVEAKLGDFKPANVADLEKEFDVFVDGRIDEFKKTAEILGVKVEADVKKGDGKSDEKKGGEPSPDAKTSSGVIEDKYLDPEQNPFIPRV